MSASSILRNAERATSLVAQAARGSQVQGVRSVGKLPVTPNKFVEDWGTNRENLEAGYTFSKSNLTQFALFGVGVPLFFYFGTLNDYNKSDEFAGRPRKWMWGNQQ